MPTASVRRGGRSSTLGFHIDGLELAQLSKDLRGMDRQLNLELRRSVRRAGAGMAKQVKANASWSTRIPGAVKTTTSLRGKRAGVAVRIDARRAPHARPLENLGRQGSFRHPVHGDRDTWVAQAARLFFFRATSAAFVGQAQDEILEAMARVATRAGFRR